jgi:hypothetical protein
MYYALKSPSKIFAGFSFYVFLQCANLQALPSMLFTERDIITCQRTQQCLLAFNSNFPFCDHIFLDCLEAVLMHGW